MPSKVRPSRADAASGKIFRIASSYFHHLMNIGGACPSLTRRCDTGKASRKKHAPEHPLIQARTDPSVTG